MNIALIGYGKMGKTIEQLALDRGWSVPIKLDIGIPLPENSQRKTVDAAIHFATAKTLVEDLTPWAESGVPVVIGTTGWNDKLADIQHLAQEYNIGVVHAANFSLGVNVFFRIAKEASKMMNKFADYDVSIHEVHHKEKIDSPSGTALQLGKIVLTEIDRKKELLTAPPDGKIKPEQLHVSSSRTGWVIGEHSLEFDSIADAIEIKHTAKNRNGLALGALVAAEWVQHKHGIFTMDDVLEDLFT
ncbi:MAG TPA: 4-hydroxy-tetrahydrodipicolinate reductase [Bacteroidota bacterium]|nr:4-hydroxy-tetrahydrodipicolinate reductase [Bacteroidota bacterium]